MDRRSKHLLILYFFLTTLTAAVLFSPGFELTVPYFVGLALLLSLYLIPIAATQFGSLSRARGVLYLTTTTVVAMLVVIDPVEIGLYGYDPYMHTIPSVEYMRTGPSLTDFLNREDAWPAFYAGVVLLEEFGLPPLAISKYLPLVAAAAPALLYIGLCRTLENNDAFLVAVGFASTRTLLLFESKFLSESMAVLLLFLIVLIFLSAPDTKSRSAALFGAVTVLVFTHHAVAAFLIFLLFLWPVTVYILQLPWIPRRLQPTEDDVTPRFVYGLVAGILFVTLFIDVGSEFAGWLLANLLSALEAGQGAAVAGLSGGEASIRGYLTQAALPLFVVCAAVVAAGQFSSRQQPEWVSGWSAFAGVIATLYAVSLVAGAFVPLDPIRFLIILVPFLMAATVGVLVGRRAESRSSWRQAAVVVLVVALVVTQLPAIPAHVLFSDPSETVIGEGHYSAPQWAASDWAGTYLSDPLVVFERGLWIAGGTADPRERRDECVDYRVWREDSGLVRDPSSNTVYSAGPIAVEDCAQ